MKTSQRIATGAVGIAAALTLAACSGAPAPAGTSGSGDPAAGGMDKLIADAQAEGELTYYGDANETTLQKWTQGFTEKYDIPVTVLRMPGSELSQRFMQEEAAGQHVADLFSITDRPSMDRAVDAGFIMQYTPAGGADFPAEDSNPGYYYPVQNGSFQTVVYNTSLLTEDQIAEIREDPFTAAADPQFKGMVGVNMPQSSQQIAAWYYQLTDGSAKDQYGWDTLKAIAENVNPSYIQSSATLVQSVVQGEFPIALGITDSLVASYVTQGAPVEFVYPKPTIGSTFETGITAQTSHPNAAKLFMEWATTPEANELYTSITQMAPLNTKAENNSKLLDQAWYEAPDEASVWRDFITDEEFLKASGKDGDFLDTWNETFGYSG